MFFAICPLFAKTIYVSKNGNDANAGTKEKPYRTLKIIRKILSKDNSITEIVFGEGQYIGQATIPKHKGKTPPKTLTIRAINKGDVTLDGAHTLTEGEVVKVNNAPGVYHCKRKFNLRNPPRPWEEDTRVRYQEVTDLATVKTAPGTYSFDKENLYFHTSDSKALKTHNVGIAVFEYGFLINRENTVIKGIKFKNYQMRYRSSGIYLRASNCSIINCHAWNSRCGFSVNYKAANALIDNVIAEDCGNGVYSNGNDTVTINSVFIKKRDRFMVQTYEQDDCGIQYYYPSKNGKAAFNLIIGFSRGIFFKAKGHFFADHNTIVDCKSGIWRSNNAAGDIFTNNILYNTDNPFPGSRKMKPKTVNDYNCIWKVRNRQYLNDILDELPRGGSGKHNIIAPPLFVDPKKNDYRLLPSSVCVKSSTSAKPLGALPVVSEKYRDKTPPDLSLKLLAPALRTNSSGKLVFERDPWIGGGSTVIREMFKTDKNMDYVVEEQSFDMIIDASDSAGECTKIKTRINDGVWESEDFRTRKKITLPETEGIYTISCKVRDDSGNWSKAVQTRVLFEKSKPELKTKPVVYANDHGVIISFETITPTIAEITFGADSKLDQTMKESQPVERNWNSNDGGDWVKYWKKPRFLHHFAITKPLVRSNTKYSYRLKLTGLTGKVAITSTATFKVQGPLRTLYVGRDGTDTQRNSKKDKPYKSLQFAVDHALPGDTIVILPGIYTPKTTIQHGGLKGFPITIKAERRGEVILDGIRRVHSLLFLDKTPYITISDLVIRGFDSAGAGIYLADSPNCVVNRCRISNGLNEDPWPVGYGIFAHRSPALTLTSNLILKNEWGVTLLQSPRSIIQHNTGFRNLYYPLGLIYSSNGTEVTSNAFCFNGNDQLSISESSSAAFKSLICDYNNYATHIRKISMPKDGVKIEKRDAAEVSGSKALIYSTMPDPKKPRYRSIKKWAIISSKDKNSIYKNPGYVSYEPYDFRLQPDSPNIGAGKDGTDIGAFGVLNK